MKPGRRLAATLSAALVLAAALAVAGAAQFQATAFTVDHERRIVEIGPNDSIQEAIDYAAAQGAYQVYDPAYGTTEQHGEPWVVMLRPGTYHQGGIVMKNGVNISSYGPRTVLVFSDNIAAPIFTCGTNATISGITIEQWNAGYPALRVVHGGSQCSIHNSIIAGRYVPGNLTAGYSILVEGGFLRMFDTDIRNGKVVLHPTVNYPIGNPVAFNCVRCRMWHDDFYVRGDKNALYLFQDSSFGSDMDNMSILSTATGHVDGRVLGSNNIHRVEVTGTFKTLIRDADMDILTIASGATADIYGSFVENTGISGTANWHHTAPSAWLENRVDALESP